MPYNRNEKNPLIVDGKQVVFDENTLGALLVAVLFRNGEEMTLTMEDIEEARSYGVELVRNSSFNDDTVTVRVNGPWGGSPGQKRAWKRA